ncbi:MAG TPA: hypothetical protein VGD61_21750 [Pyrinomonadaceae bacterium]
MSHEVYLVLDPQFADDLWSLSRGAHVWIIKTAENEAAARAVWDRETERHSPLRGVTIFDSSGEAYDDFYRILPTIEDHHDEYSAPEPWNAIHVIGLSGNIRRDRIADALGVDDFEVVKEGEGFAIKRTAKVEKVQL